MSARRSISRRQFMKSASAATFGATLLLRGGAAAAPPQAGKSRVVLIRDLNVLDENGQPKAAAVQEMLDAGIAALTGKPDAPAAWKTIVHPGDVVGLKNNRWPYLRTTPEVEGGLGVPRETVRLVGDPACPRLVTTRTVSMVWPLCRAVTRIHGRALVSMLQAMTMGRPSGWKISTR